MNQLSIISVHKVGYSWSFKSAVFFSSFVREIVESRQKWENKTFKRVCVSFVILWSESSDWQKVILIPGVNRSCIGASLGCGIIGEICSNCMVLLWPNETKISAECFQHLVESRQRKLRQFWMKKALQLSTSRVHLTKGLVIKEANLLADRICIMFKVYSVNTFSKHAQAVSLTFLKLGSL